MPVVAYPVAAFLLSLLLLVWHPLFSLPVIIMLGGLMGLVLYFFRDPEREIGKGVVSPADGVLVRAEVTDNGAYFSIFMNVHNVHVNRAPWPGRVTELCRMSGGHRPAYEKAAVKNERLRTTIEGSLGAMTVTQMVGMVARRILPYVGAGRMLKKGERIGIIRLGSRVDLFIPSTKLGLVARKGDRVLAGTTTLAMVKDDGSGEDEGSGGRGQGSGAGQGPQAAEGRIGEEDRGPMALRSSGSGGRGQGSGDRGKGAGDDDEGSEDK